MQNSTNNKGRSGFCRVTAWLLTAVLIMGQLCFGTSFSLIKAQAAEASEGAVSLDVSVKGPGGHVLSENGNGNYSLSLETVEGGLTSFNAPTLEYVVTLHLDELTIDGESLKDLLAVNSSLSIELSVHDYLVNSTSAATPASALAGNVSDLSVETANGTATATLTLNDVCDTVCFTVPLAFDKASYSKLLTGAVVRASVVSVSLDGDEQQIEVSAKAPTLTFVSNDPEDLFDVEKTAGNLDENLVSDITLSYKAKNLSSPVDIVLAVDRKLLLEEGETVLSALQNLKKQSNKNNMNLRVGLIEIDTEARQIFALNKIENAITYLSNYLTDSSVDASSLTQTSSLSGLESATELGVSQLSEGGRSSAEKILVYLVNQDSADTNASATDEQFSELIESGCGFADFLMLHTRTMEAVPEVYSSREISAYATAESLLTYAEENSTFRTVVARVGDETDDALREALLNWTANVGSLYEEDTLEEALNDMEGELIPRMGEGSLLVDELGDGFNFVNDISTLKLVSGGAYLVAKEGYTSMDGETACYVFENEETGEVYKLHYFENGCELKNAYASRISGESTYDTYGECVVLEIGQDIQSVETLKLRYQIRVANPMGSDDAQSAGPNASGAANADTNAAGTTYSVGSYDRDGSEGYANLETSVRTILFPMSLDGTAMTPEFPDVPTVSYAVYVPSVRKVQEGRDVLSLSAEEYFFSLTDEQTGRVYYAANKASGEVDFLFDTLDEDGNKVYTALPGFFYTEADAGSTYTYTVRELGPEDLQNEELVAALEALDYDPEAQTGVAYDETVYTVSVSVTFDGESVSAEAAVVNQKGKEAEEMLFTNFFGAYLTVKANVTVNGQTPADGTFVYTLTCELKDPTGERDEYGSVKTQEVAVKATNVGGEVTFPAICFSGYDDERLITCTIHQELESAQDGMELASDKSFVVYAYEWETLRLNDITDLNGLTLQTTASDDMLHFEVTVGTFRNESTNPAYAVAEEPVDADAEEVVEETADEAVESEVESSEHGDESQDMEAESQDMEAESQDEAAESESNNDRAKSVWYRVKGSEDSETGAEVNENNLTSDIH